MNSQIPGALSEFSLGYYNRSQESGTELSTAPINFSISLVGMLWSNTISDKFIIGEHLSYTLLYGNNDAGYQSQVGAKAAYCINDDVDFGYKLILEFRNTVGEHSIVMLRDLIRLRYSAFIFELGLDSKLEENPEKNQSSNKFSSLEIKYLFYLDGGSYSPFIALKTESYTPQIDDVKLNGKTSTFTFTLGYML